MDGAPLRPTGTATMVLLAARGYCLAGSIALASASKVMENARISKKHQEFRLCRQFLNPLNMVRRYGGRDNSLSDPFEALCRPPRWGSSMLHLGFVLEWTFTGQGELFRSEKVLLGT